MGIKLIKSLLYEKNGAVSLCKSSLTPNQLKRPNEITLGIICNLMLIISIGKTAKTH